MIGGSKGSQELALTGLRVDVGAFPPELTQTIANQDMCQRSQKKEQHCKAYYRIDNRDRFLAADDKHQIDQRGQCTETQNNAQKQFKNEFDFHHGRIIGVLGGVLQFSWLLMLEKCCQSFCTEKASQRLEIGLARIHNDQAFERFIEPGVDIEADQPPIQRQIVP